MKKTMIFSLLCLLGSGAFACSCLYTTVEENIRSADVIFTGKVLHIDTVKMFVNFDKNNAVNEDSLNNYAVYQYSVTIQVSKVFKGKLTKKTVNILTGIGSGDCGYYFIPGKEYIIYSRKQDLELIDESGAKPKVQKKVYLSTTSCDRTTSDIKKEKKLVQAALLRKKI